MKLLFTTLFSLLIFSAIGQSKFERKVERLYNKGKYEKCIKKGKKHLKKERRSPEIQYYIVKASLAIYSEAPEKRKYSLLRKTIINWERLEKYNKPKNDYSDLREEIMLSMNSEAESPKLMGTPKANYYHKKLAEVFKDTSDYYRSLHPIYIVTKSTPQIKEVITDIHDSLSHLSDERRKILQAAQRVIGVKYKYGGEDTTGFDCSGFTKYIYRSAGLELPHNANQQSKVGDTVELSKAKPGDLIFFGSNSRAYHAGLIYSNNNGEISLVHCASRGVTYNSPSDLNTKYWLEKVLRIQQIIPNEKQSE